MSPTRTTLDLVPVARVTTAQSAAHQILELIRGGTWVAGDKLPTEKELGEQLDIGRSTVREAMQILATLNVVQPMPGQGTFIKAPTTADVLRGDLIGFLIGRPDAIELLEAREMIEPTVARLAALRGTQSDFAAIEALLDAHAAALARGESVAEHAARFHVLMAEASHNKVAVVFMSSILDLLTHRGRRIDHIPDYLNHELAEHRALLAALRSGDAEHAAASMLAHILESVTTYELDAAPPPQPATRRHSP